MKKVVGLVLSLSVLLVGCNNLPEVINEVPTESDKRFNGLHGISMIKDSETGCKYLYVEQGSLDSARIALSPLLKSDGTADCELDEKEKIEEW